MSGQKIAPRGRPPGPSKLTPEVGERLRRLVRAGVPIEQAALASGVSPRSVRRWRAAGELDLEEAVGEVGMILGLARSRSWQAAAFVLETQFPERWAALPPRSP